jgi:hypothetical protein
MLHALTPVTGLLHIGLALHFSCPDAADHDVDMDISRMVVSVRVGADDSRMTGKVLFAEVQAEGLCLFHRQPIFGRIRGFEDVDVLRTDYDVHLCTVAETGIHAVELVFAEAGEPVVDTGFGDRTQVDVVIRPEDIYIFEPSDAAQLTGTVTSSIFKGVHYEMLVQTREGYELMVQDYHCFEAGREVGLLVKPFDIHVMKKERTCNTFEGKLLDETHVEFLGCSFECSPVQDIGPETPVTVEVDFQNVILEDNEEDGRLTGEVKFILYKGNHYHLTVFTDWDENIFVDTNDVWDDGDRVGIRIAPENIRVIKR